MYAAMLRGRPSLANRFGRHPWLGAGGGDCTIDQQRRAAAAHRSLNIAKKDSSRALSAPAPLRQCCGILPICCR